jgi:hypothetical protein
MCGTLTKKIYIIRKKQLHENNINSLLNVYSFFSCTIALAMYNMQYV